MALTFDSYVTTMCGLMSITPESALKDDQPDLLEQMINYAELRIYRELDLLSTVTEATTPDLTPGDRSVSVPGNIFIINSATVITPASTAPDDGTRNPLQRTSVEFINAVWPNASLTGVPSHFALKDNDTIILAPTPDAGYRVCCMGVFRPNTLSATNQTTFLTENIPDLFIAASAIFGFGGILQNFGAQSDDPQAVQSWESQYQNLRAGVDMENLRSKSWSTGWQPWSPSPGAKEPRS